MSPGVDALVAAVRTTLLDTDEWLAVLRMGLGLWWLESWRHKNKEAWFEQIRSLASDHGFAPTAGQYKKNPENFAGSISHVSNAIRIALTGLTQSPELFLVAQNIGEAEVLRRIRALTQSDASRNV